jgi:hypothetical protein
MLAHLIVIGYFGATVPAPVDPDVLTVTPVGARDALSVSAAFPDSMTVTPTGARESMTVIPT